MALRMDPLVERMVDFIAALVSRFDYQFSTDKEENRRRVILQLMDAHDLARLVRRKGIQRTWMATEILACKIAPVTRDVQPRPVKVLPWSRCKYNGQIDDKAKASVAALFHRHCAQCIKWVRMDCVLAEPGTDGLNMKLRKALLAARPIVLDRILSKCVRCEQKLRKPRREPNRHHVPKVVEQRESV
jgi:hypothetical protein